MAKANSAVEEDIQKITAIVATKEDIHDLKKDIDSLSKSIQALLLCIQQIADKVGIKLEG